MDKDGTFGAAFVGFTVSVLSGVLLRAFDDFHL
jgi:hypothetical protein